MATSLGSPVRAAPPQWEVPQTISGQPLMNTQVLLPRTMSSSPVTTAVPVGSMLQPSPSVVHRAVTLPSHVVLASPTAAARGKSTGSDRSLSARRKPRRRRPSPEELEAHFRELEAFKKEEERRKKEADKAQKQQAVQEKRNLQRNLQQAQKEANSRQSEVDRLLRQLEKVEHEQERQSARKFQQQERLDEGLRKLREEKYDVEKQYEGKLAEAGEARGRLDAIEAVLAKEAPKALHSSDGNGHNASIEDGLERAQQELLRTEMSQLRTRIHMMTMDNSRLRQDLADLRRAVAQRRSQGADASLTVPLPVKLAAPHDVRMLTGTSSHTSLPQTMATSSVSRQSSPTPATIIASPTIGGSPATPAPTSFVSRARSTPLLSERSGGAAPVPIITATTLSGSMESAGLLRSSSSQSLQMPQTLSGRLQPSSSLRSPIQLQMPASLSAPIATSTRTASPLTDARLTWSAPTQLSLPGPLRETRVTQMLPIPVVSAQLLSTQSLRAPIVADAPVGKVDVGIQAPSVPSSYQPLLQGTPSKLQGTPGPAIVMEVRSQ